MKRAVEIAWRAWDDSNMRGVPIVRALGDSSDARADTSLPGVGEPPELPISEAT
jgi:hypothetical protein